MVRGHASYVLADSPRIRVLLPRAGEVVTADGFYVELGAGSEVLLSWPGAASARVQGPAAVQWAPVPEEPEGPPGERAAASSGVRPTATSDRQDAAPRLTLTVSDVRRAEVEVRDGGLVLELPSHGWQLEVPKAALRIETRTDQRLTVQHHGGEPVRLYNRATRAPGGWPTRILPGRPVVLPLFERPQ
jgi:hypothetical protein